jgi:hypothetical protein
MSADRESRPAYLPAERCTCLRTKGMYIEVEPDPLVPNPHDGLFWCRHTLTCLGPDGEVADERNCRPGRGCYEEL